MTAPHTDKRLTRAEWLAECGTAFQEAGRRGSAATMANTTPEERTAIARHAAKVRWAAATEDQRKAQGEMLAKARRTIRDAPH